jgi:glycosyltransferase involved in cell wall biosynthesis
LSARHELTLLSLADEPISAAARAELARFCRIAVVGKLTKVRAVFNLARALVDRRPLQQAYYTSPVFGRRLRALIASESFDVIHATYGLRLAPYLEGIDPERVLLDLTDAQSLGLRSRRDRTRLPMRWLYDLELRRVERSERELARRFPHVVVTGEADRAELGAPSVTVVRNGVDLGRFEYTNDGRERDLVIMTGNMGYQPNVDGALWFAANVWPRVLERRPAARWSIVGARPATSLRALHGCDNITVVGAVDDLALRLRGAAVAIAPTLCGAGIQNKVLEAFASGTPVVATSFANQGVQASDGEHLLIADEPDLFAEHVVTLLENRERGQALAHWAHQFVAKNFTWEAHATQLERTYERIAATLGGGRVAGPSATAPGPQIRESAPQAVVAGNRHTARRDKKDGAITGVA